MGLFWTGKVPLERAGRKSGMQLVVILGRVNLDKLSGLGLVCLRKELELNGFTHMEQW